MKTHLQIAILSVASLAIAAAASAYDYGWDPNKAPLGGNNSMYMELAQDPTIIVDGVYAGKYEYFFDLYNVNTTFYLFHLVGLDNDKIANKFQDRPDDGQFRTQRWGDPDLMGNPEIYELWPVATGRILEMWSQRNFDLAAATQFDVSVTSYDDGVGGWTDSGLGYPGTSTANPHSYNEYVDFTAWGGGADLWKAELTGAPPQPLHWFNTQFDIEPQQDVIFVPGSPIWAPPGFGGLVMTLRIVYDEVIDPETIGWSGDATPAYDILGDFTVPLPPLGSFDGDYDVDDEDIDMLCDFIRLGLPYDAEYDISADGTSGGSDGFVDLLDLAYHVRSLVETAIGNGTEYGDFNLDGMVDTTDLTRLATNYGDNDWKWNDGNANRYIDTNIDNTDLTILATYYGTGPGDPDVVPEPMTLSLLALGAYLPLFRRKRR